MVLLCTHFNSYLPCFSNTVILSTILLITFACIATFVVSFALFSAIALMEAQEQNDYEQVAKYYLDLGETYKKEGKLSKATYYLNRFDNLVGGDDDLYEKFQKQNEQAMQWIDELEAKQMPYEKIIQEQVVETSEELNDLQKIKWMLLTNPESLK